MKQLLLFILIITICGSLSKPPIVVQPCGSKIMVKDYLNGKLVHIDMREKMYTIYGNPIPMNCNYHEGIKFRTDSVTYEVSFKKLIDVFK